MNFRELSDAPNNNDIRTLHDTIMSEILPQVARQTNISHILEFTRNYRAKTLKLLTNHQGNAARTLELRPNGYLWAPPGQHHLNILDDKYDLVRDISYRIRQTVAQAVLIHPETRTGLLRMAAHSQHTEVANTLSQVVQALLKDVLSTYVTPRGTRQVKPRHINGLWNRLARDHFIHPSVYQVTKSIGIPMTTRNHNAVLTNMHLLEDRPENLGARRILRTALASSGTQLPPKRIRDTNDLITVVGRALSIPPEWWHHLPTAMATATLVYNIPPSETVYATCKALDTIKTPLADGAGEQIARMAANHHAFLKAGKKRWEQWIQLLEQYAKDPGNIHLYAEREKLQKETFDPEPREPQGNPIPTRDRANTLPHYTKDLVEHIQERGRKHAAASLGTWTPWKHTHNDQKTTVDIVTAPGKDSVLTITKHSDGTIFIDQPADQGRTIIHQEARHLSKLLTNNIAQYLLEDTARAHPVQLAKAAMHDNVLQKVATTARRTAKELASELVTTKDPTDLTHLVSRTNNHVNKEILDRRTVKLAVTLFHPYENLEKKYYKLTTVAYNTVVLNEDMFEKMVASGQYTPLRTYCLQFISKADAAPALAHPGEIITQVKTFLDLTPAQWRYFCRAAGTIPANHLLQWAKKRISLAAQALVDANRPSAHDNALMHVWKRHPDHDLFSKAEWQHGDPWKTWTHLLNQFLVPDPHHTTQDLDEITDALRYHIRNQLPWGPGPWDVLVGRSERWHWEQFGRDPGRRRMLPKEGQKARWDSVLDTITIDGFTFTPITTGPKLALTGARMGNCLATYWSQCKDGLSRIFTISTNSKPIAAVELGKDPPTWTRGQIQGSHTHRITTQMIRAANKLAKAYQDKEQRLRDKDPANRSH